MAIRLTTESTFGAIAKAAGVDHRYVCRLVVDIRPGRPIAVYAENYGENWLADDLISLFRESDVVTLHRRLAENTP